MQGYAALQALHKVVLAQAAGLAIRSVPESQEESYASSDPDLLFFSARELNEEAEICRMTRCGESTGTGQHFVDGAIVDAGNRLLTLVLG